MVGKREKLVSERGNSTEKDKWGKGRGGNGWVGERENGWVGGKGKWDRKIGWGKIDGWWTGEMGHRGGENGARGDGKFGGERGNWDRSW